MIFGSEVVNKLFNKPSLPKKIYSPSIKEDSTYETSAELENKQIKRYQNTLLALYSEKDGIKNYNMLKETLIKLLEKEISNYSTGYFNYK